VHQFQFEFEKTGKKMEPLPSQALPCTPCGIDAPTCIDDTPSLAHVHTAPWRSSTGLSREHLLRPSLPWSSRSLVSHPDKDGCLNYSCGSCGSVRWRDQQVAELRQGHTPVTWPLRTKHGISLFRNPTKFDCLPLFGFS
jgi:hypothetical protein